MVPKAGGRSELEMVHRWSTGAEVSLEFTERSGMVMLKCLGDRIGSFQLFIF